MTDRGLVKRLLERRGGDRAATAILANATECAVMLHDGAGSTGRYHFGGLAHEPVDGPSGREIGLSLLAEIFFDEVAHFAGRESLPDDGLLQVWGDPEDPAQARLVYHSGDTQLRVATATRAFRRTAIRFQARVSIMDYVALGRLGVDEASGLDYEEFYEHVRELRGSGIEMVTGATIPTFEGSGYPTMEAFTHSTFAADVAHQLLGHPASIQDENWPADKRLPLQLDSDLEGPGWMWGDGGVIWFHITEDALANRRFDEATCMWSSC